MRGEQKKKTVVFVRSMAMKGKEQKLGSRPVWVVLKWPHSLAYSLSVAFGAPEDSKTCTHHGVSGYLGQFGTSGIGTGCFRSEAVSSMWGQTGQLQAASDRTRGGVDLQLFCLWL